MRAKQVMGMDNIRVNTSPAIGGFDAVVAANGELPTRGPALDVLRGARFLCCCDGAGERLWRLGFRPDVVVGDGDSLSDDFRSSYDGVVERVSEQEDNDLTKATRLCVSRGFRRIAYVGCTGMREDHTLGNIFLMPRYRRDFGLLPVMITDYGYFIPASGDAAFATFARQQVSIFNVSCLHLSGEGLRWQPYTYTQLWQGTLNEAVGDTVVMYADGEYIMYFTHEAKQAK